MMDYWEWHSGPLLSGPQEVLVLTQAGVSLYDGDAKTKWQGGTLRVTTHHLIYQEGAAGGNTLRLQMENLHKSGRAPALARGGVFSSDKIVLNLPGDRYGKISFKAGGAKEAYAALCDALQKKQWRITGSGAGGSSSGGSGGRHAGDPQQQQQQRRVSDGNDDGAGAGPTSIGPAGSVAGETRTGASRLGIAAVVQHSKQSATLQQDGALRDVDDVMSKASALVGGIRALRERQASAGGGGGASAADADTLQSIEATLGLGTLVTREGGVGRHAAEFHAQLAAELHAWMTHESNQRLFSRMPIVPLIELFALYNRARSGDLVSPGDVLAACQALDRLPAGGSRYSLEKLSSGRMALVHRDDRVLLRLLVPFLGPQLTGPHSGARGTHNTAAAGLRSTTDESGRVVSERLSTAHHTDASSSSASSSVPSTTQFPAGAAGLGSVTEVQFSATLGVAMSVARDTLQRLEQRGHLCRSDAGFGCCTYYWNIFVF